jgi:hypothetical protein
MSPDRHADRLHAQLAGGAPLTRDQQRHVATCAACQRAVAEVGRLDEQLRAAAAGLASEPIPDADLEPIYVPRSRWAAPLSVVVAAGLIGIVIGYALGQVRPPTGADATPFPSAVAQQSGRPSPAATATAVPVPSPSPSPPPDPNARPIPLAAGGDTCADGRAGFTMIVPDGWYANLRIGDVMACAFLAPEPFDPLAAGTDPGFDAPIVLTTSVDSAPAGTVVDEPAGGSTAETWTVEREGEDWLVTVVELFSSIGDEPAFLHLQTRAADGAGTEALNAILDDLTVGDPLVADEDAIADAESLFADADVCSDLERGVNVIMPDVWWTNTVLGDLLPCTYYAPESFAVPDDGGMPEGVPIALELVTGEAEPIEEVIGFETLVVDNRAAIREEGLLPDTDVYRYVVALDEGSLVLTLRSERSDDYERDKAVLDEMMRRLLVSPTPKSVLEGGRLPSCGWELVERTPDGDRYDPDVRICLLEAHDAGEPAEMVRTGPTVEGGIIREIYRVLGPDEIEVIIDWTHDPLGQGGWQLMRCTALEQTDGGGVTGEVGFTAESCDDPVTLEP